MLRLPPAGLSFGVLQEANPNPNPSLNPSPNLSLRLGALQEAPGPNAMKRVEFNSHGCVSRVGRASTLPPTHYGARILPGDILGCVYDAPSRAVSWTLDGKRLL